MYVDLYFFLFQVGGEIVWWDICLKVETNRSFLFRINITRLLKISYSRRSYTVKMMKTFFQKIDYFFESIQTVEKPFFSFLMLAYET